MKLPILPPVAAQNSKLSVMIFQYETACHVLKRRQYPLEDTMKPDILNERVNTTERGHIMPF
jgi:hypothetical protein